MTRKLHILIVIDVSSRAHMIITQSRDMLRLVNTELMFYNGIPSKPSSHFELCIIQHNMRACYQLTW